MNILPTFSLRSLPLTRLQESSWVQIHHYKRVTAGQRPQSCVLPPPLQGNPESHQQFPVGPKWGYSPALKGCGLERM